MLSFTSNFKQLIKISSTFLAIFIIYNIYIIRFCPNVTIYQNQSQANYISAQEYIYSSVFNIIIVGSSMAARLDKDILSKNNIYNLAFPGGSALTGLKILQNTKRIPKTIYIEDNIILSRELDQTMINNLFNPIQYELKKYIPALREKYQPFNIMGSYIKNILGGENQKKLHQTIDQRIFKILLKSQIKDYTNNLENYKHNLDLLKELLTYFNNLGTQIIFFEMPINEELTQQKKYIQQTKILKENFKYKWLPIPKHKEFTTTDGIHITPQSSVKFTKEFISNIQSNKLNKNHKDK